MRCVCSSLESYSYLCNLSSSNDSMGICVYDTPLSVILLQQVSITLLSRTKPLIPLKEIRVKVSSDYQNSVRVTLTEPNNFHSEQCSWDIPGVQPQATSQTHSCGSPFGTCPAGGLCVGLI